MNAESTRARILDGKATALVVRRDVAVRVAALRRLGCVPGLAVLLVGDDPASEVYVRNKDKAAAEAGFAVRTIREPAHTAQEALMARLRELDLDAGVHGILVQLPLPRHLDSDALLSAIDPRKDVDGLTPTNVAALWRGEDGLVPCTPAGCIEILLRHGIEIAGKRALVIGRSQLVGKPLAALLLARDATVTIGHSRTRDLALLARGCDIVVAAVGRAELVRGDWIKPGAVVLDVGINRALDGRIVGDVSFDEVAAVASAVTPVPGGIGPMTIAMLLRNTALAAARSRGLDYDALARAE